MRSFSQSREVMRQNSSSWSEMLKFNTRYFRKKLQIVAAVDVELTWSVAGRGSFFERCMKYQTRRLAVSTKTNRNSRFDKLKESDLQYFRNSVGEKGVIVDKDELAVANIDWMHKYEGHSKLLLRPQTTRQVRYS